MAKVHGNDPTGYGYAEADALKAAARGLAQSIGDGARAWEQRKREREENFFVGATHGVSTWFGAEDDPKPPEPKPEPRLRSEQVDLRCRTIPSAGGGSGSTSSAVPADLRSFATNTRGADTSVAGAATAFSRSLADYDSSCNTAWGSLDGQSLRTAVGVVPEGNPEF